MADKKQKTKVITGHGNLTVSNVNSEVSECITLTYDVYHVPTVDEAKKIKKEFSRLAETDEVDTEAIFHNFDTRDQDIQLKFKVKKCGSEKEARNAKTRLDKFVKRQGGQTTLTEQFDEEQKKADKKNA